MKVFLPDINLLVALLWPRHTQHQAAVRWFNRNRAGGWSTCPFTEAGFVRIVSNPAFSRDAVSPREAVEVLHANTVAKDHCFWPYELPVKKALSFAGSRVAGHQQITDAYLLGLALQKGGALATFDRGISALLEPNSPDQAALEIVPC